MSTNSYANNKHLYEKYDAGKETPVEIKIQDISDAVFIGNSKNTIFQVTGKCKSITLSGCTDCAVIVGTVVSVVEVIRSNKLQIQIDDIAPTVTVDASSRITFFLSAAGAAGTTLIASKSDSINVNVPKGEDDQQELAVPEQIECKFAGGLTHRVLTAQD